MKIIHNFYFWDTFYKCAILRMIHNQTVKFMISTSLLHLTCIVETQDLSDMLRVQVTISS